MLTFDLTPVKDVYVSKVCVKWFTILFRYYQYVDTLHFSVYPNAASCMFTLCTNTQNLHEITLLTVAYGSFQICSIKLRIDEQHLVNSQFSEGTWGKRPHNIQTCIHEVLGG